MTNELDDALGVIEYEHKKILGEKMQNQFEDFRSIENSLFEFGACPNDEVEFYTVESAFFSAGAAIVLPERGDEPECGIFLRKSASYPSVLAAMSDYDEIQGSKGPATYALLYRMPMWMSDCVPRETGSGIPDDANLDEYVTCLVSRNGIHVIRRTEHGVLGTSHPRYNHEFGLFKLVDELYYGIYCF